MRSVSFATGSVPPLHLVASLKFPGPVKVLFGASAPIGKARASAHNALNRSRRAARITLGEYRGTGRHQVQVFTAAAKRPAERDVRPAFFILLPALPREIPRALQTLTPRP